jgi:aspartyl-tRNA(Asn)/glutamyl-tRNA(Gln) amidotransferase subunit A
VQFDSIASAAAALQSGRTTSRALIDDAIAAFSAHGPRTNALIRIHAEAAREAAVVADERRRRGADESPLAGIPITIKDLIDEAGVATSAASRVLDDRVAAADAPVVARLRAAGAIILGRTNLHEFAFGTTSEDSAYGAVRHPDDPARSAGGSSGGSAAAVATGIGLASIGTDTGGSVRIPAAACGLVGLKPTHGEVPTEGVVPLSSSFDHVGPIARTVQDAAWLYQAAAARPFGAVRGRAVDRLTLGVLGGYFASPIAADVRLAFDAAVARLTNAGARVEPRIIDGTGDILETYVNVMLPEAAAWHARYLDTRASAYTPGVGRRLAEGRAIAAVDHLRARERCAAFAKAVDAALDHADALILPTLPIVAPVLGTTDIVVDESDGRVQPLRAVMLKHTQLFNMTGHPAISVPVPSAGLPVGLQIVGRRQETAALLDIAAACERAVGQAESRA